MAKIETYQQDTQLTNEDLLTGSNYVSPGVYTTKNYKLGDIASFIGGSVAVSDLSLKNNGGIIKDSGLITLDLGASAITGTLAITDGGTGQTTASAAFNAIKQVATTTNTGVASFDSNYFTVTGGAVTLATTSTTAELNILDGVTASTAELNILDGVTVSTAELNILNGVTATDSELNLVDGATAGTVANSKAVIYGSSGEVNATTLQVAGSSITSSVAELNILDGVTASTAELNILDGVTSSTAELNILDGVTATATELNLLDGVTSSTAELNILDGVTSTATELNILDGKAFLDEDNMASDSATGIASQQSIKAYVLSNPVNCLVGNQTITLSGDVTGSGATSITTTIAADAVHATMVNDDIISGQTELTSGNVVDADEMLISDGGTIKKVGMDSLKAYFPDTNTQNTTTLSFVDSTNDVILRNTTGGAGSGTQDIKFVAGSNVTLTPSGTNMTIASQAFGTVHTVSSESAMISATSTGGDIVIRTDVSKTFIHNGGSAGTAADFSELQFSGINNIALTAGDGITLSRTTITNTDNDLTITNALATDTVTGGIQLFSNTDQSVAANSVTTTASRTYGLQLNSADQGVVNVPWTDTVYTLPVATNSALGGIKIGYTDNGKNYALELDGDNEAYVNVPWTDTVYTLPLSADGTRGGVQIGYAENGKNYPVELSSEKMFVNVPWVNTEYSAMTDSALGLGKLRYTRGSTPAAETKTETANRTYGITDNSNNQLVVNVPWVNTTYDIMGSGNSYAAGLVLAGNATHNSQFLRKDGTWVVPDNDNTFRTIKVDTNNDGTANETIGATEELKLLGGTNVTLAESAGTVTITSTDTNTNELTKWTIRDDDDDDKLVEHGNFIKFESAVGAAGTNITGAGTTGNPWIMTITSPNDNTQLTTEEVQDIVGAMFTNNTETRISADYQDSDGTIDLVVDDMNYTLPLAASGTRGGVKIGYAENGKNYPVELDSEKMFVNVPWTDTDNNSYINAASFNTSTGVLTLSGVGSAGATVDLDNRYLTSYSETDTLATVTGRGASTTTATNFTGSLTVNGSGAGAYLYVSGNANGTTPPTSYDTGMAFVWNNSAGSRENEIYYATGSGASQTDNDDSYFSFINRFNPSGTPTDTRTFKLFGDGRLVIKGNYQAHDGTNLIYNSGATSYFVANKYTLMGNATNPGTTAATFYDQANEGPTISGLNVCFRTGSTPSQTGKLNSSGTFTVSGDVVAFGSPSDISLKENIKPIENALDKVEKLQGVTFDWKEKQEDILDIKEDIGFIAQDVQKVLPELVKENDNGKLSLRHHGIVPVLLEAIKELSNRIKVLENGSTK